MALSEQIKVDLYGQYNNDTAHVYSYPERITNQYSFTEGNRWAAAITDPRALFQSVCKNGPCYLIYRHKNGYYYSIIERNLTDSRGGLEMVTVFVPKGLYASGLSILAALKDLESLLIKEHNYDDNQVSCCLSTIKESHSKVLFPDKTQNTLTGQMISAFRTYSNEAELADIFTFLKQQDYANIDKLLIVAELDVKEGAAVRRINSPLKRVFNIVPAKDVHSNINEVALGEKFKIIFTKDDFDSLQVEESLSLSQSRYYRINGNDVCLISPSELRITFSKRMYIRVEAEIGPSPETNRIEAVFDGQIASRDSNGRLYVKVHESSIFPESTAILAVSARGYERYQTNVDLSNIKNNGCFSVRLKPNKRLLNVAFHFGDSEKGETELLPVELPFNETDPLLGTITVEQNFFGYKTYVSGNDTFHVFIPWGHYRRNDGEVKNKRRIPWWIKAVLFSLLGVFVAIALILGGYSLRNFTSVKIPGLYTETKTEMSASTQSMQDNDNKIHAIEAEAQQAIESIENK